MLIELNDENLLRYADWLQCHRTSASVDLGTWLEARTQPRVMCYGDGNAMNCLEASLRCMDSVWSLRQ